LIPTKIKSLFLAVLGVLAVCSCSPKIEKLEIVHIGNFRVDAITREIISLRTEIVVRNPYSTSARLKNISFDLSVTDHPIAYAKLPGSTELSGGATKALDVPLAIQCKQITEKDFAALFEKMIPYTITGNAVLEKPLGPRTLPIDVHGQIAASEELQFQLSNKSALQVIALDVSGTRELASLIRQKKLSLRFYNPFSFPLSIQEFNTELHLGKALIADGVSDENLRLDPGANHIAVRVEPRARGAAGELLDFLLSRSLPDLTVSSDFQVIEKERPLKIKLIYAP
jgi:LEA14-like dessication related protein